MILCIVHFLLNYVALDAIKNTRCLSLYKLLSYSSKLFVIRDMDKILCMFWNHFRRKAEVTDGLMVSAGVSVTGSVPIMMWRS